ncbi:MAG TPA: hypothetical protein VI895_01270 [Bdellovibrionota bacterium]|nr:hypothetical protein [Bdellovibrionota bacterium]
MVHVKAAVGPAHQVRRDVIRCKGRGKTCDGPQAFGDRKGPKAMRHVRQGVFDQVLKGSSRTKIERGFR